MKQVNGYPRARLPEGQEDVQMQGEQGPEDLEEDEAEDFNRLASSHIQQGNNSPCRRR
jgi:hypothetical protein